LGEKDGFGVALQLIYGAKEMEKTIGIAKVYLDGVN
jgi:hypothetical protein